MKHLPKLEYTEADQRSDTSFLVGVSYGRQQERARIEDAVRTVRERLRRPPCWGPAENGQMMVDMEVDSYERDLDQIVRAALGEEEPVRQIRGAGRPSRKS